MGVVRKQMLRLAAAITVVVAASVGAPPRVGAIVPAYVDPLVAAAIATSPPTATLRGVAAYDHHPTSLDLAALASTGVPAVAYPSLPFAAIEGTPLQLQAVTGLSSVT